MRKYLIATIIILMAAMCFGCDSGKTDNKKTTVISDEKTGNQIKYITDGDAVTDDAVLGKNVYVFDTEDKAEDIQSKVTEILKNRRQTSLVTKDMLFYSSRVHMISRCL